MCVLSCAFISPAHVPRSGVARSYGDSVFEALPDSSPKGLHFTFPSAVEEGSGFSTSCQCLLLRDFFILPILMGVKWHLIVILSCTLYRPNIDSCVHRPREYLLWIYGEMSLPIFYPL